MTQEELVNKVDGALTPKSGEDESSAATEQREWLRREWELIKAAGDSLWTRS